MATAASSNGPSRIGAGGQLPLCMAATAWDRLQEQAVRAVREGTDADIAARQLLAAGGGDQRMVLAARLRLAAIAAHAPHAPEARRALAPPDPALAPARGEAPPA